MMLLVGLWQQEFQQDAQLSQRDRAAGIRYNLRQKYRRLELEDSIYGHYRSIFKHHNRPENLSNSVKKNKIRAITTFKVIQGHKGRYQSKARIRIPISD